MVFLLKLGGLELLVSVQSVKKTDPKVLYRNLCLKFRGSELFQMEYLSAFQKQIFRFIDIHNVEEVDTLTLTGCNRLT